MLSLSKERRDQLLKKATKLYLSLGSGGYTKTFVREKRSHDAIDCLNEPIFSEGGKDSHEITFERFVIDGKVRHLIVITSEWLLAAGLIKPNENIVLDYSEYLIKNEEGQVLRRYSCIPKLVRSMNFRHQFSLT
jgi:hypothetical protein